MDEALKKHVELWLSSDPDESTKAEIQKLVDDHKFDELRQRLDKRIAFGTAGLRGRMAAGYSCMNELTVLQASQVSIFL